MDISKRLSTAVMVGAFITTAVTHTTFANSTAKIGVSPATPLSVVKDSYEPGKVLVKFTASASVSSDRIMRARSIQSMTKRGKFSIRPLIKPVMPKQQGGVNTKKAQATVNRWHVIELPPGQDVGEAIAMLKADVDVEAAEPNHIVSVDATPNDPRYSELWGLNNTGQGTGTADADIDAPQAWEIATGDGSVIIGVLDTGVDYMHEDLVDNMWVNVNEIPGNGIDDDNNGYVDDVHGYDFLNNDSDPMDDHGHGTHVSGTIAAVGNNGIGVVGVNWNAKIMALKFIDSNGFGTVEGAAQALNYAINMGVRITNNSWGDNEESQVLYDAVAAANEAGSLVVASAGNSSVRIDGLTHVPASLDLPNVLSVAASDAADELASFSNWGPVSVDLAAPGVNVLSSVPDGFCRMCTLSGYGTASGTSMAAPHVAGAAALLLSKVPSLSVGDLKAWLMESVDIPSSLAGTSVSQGRLNIGNAMLDTDYKLSVSPSPVGIRQGESQTVTLSVAAFDSFNGPLTLSADTSHPDIAVNLAANQVNAQAGDVVDINVTLTVDVTLHANRHFFTVTSIDAAGDQKTIDGYIDVIGPDFTVSATPSSRTVGSGDSTHYVVQIESIEAHTGPITLDFETPHPSITATFSSNTVLLPVNGIGESTLTVDTAAVTPAGDYQLRVVGSDGEATREAELSLEVSETIDLTIPTATIPNQAGQQGRINVDFVARNTGNVDSGPVIWGIFLSADETVTVEDQLLADNLIFPGLTPFNDVSISVVVDLPGNVSLGQHYLGVIIDYDNKIAEANENDNVTSQPVELVPFDADLTALSASATPVTVQGGGSLTVSTEIANLGSSAVNSTTVDIYLSLDDTIDGNDFLLGSRIVALEGVSSDVISVTAPVGVAVGQYRIGVVVDAANVVDETNESNNIALGNIVNVTAATDLVISVADAPQQIAAGESFTVQVDVTNQGGLAATRTFFWSLYLSSDDQRSGDDDFLGWGSIAGLGAGETNTQNRSVTVPAAGQYYLIPVVDEVGLVPESNESNNSDARPVTVTSP